MSSNELDVAIRKAQDDSWEEGYFDGRDGKPCEPSEMVLWPSHYRIGWRAAVDDKAKRK